MNWENYDSQAFAWLQDKASNLYSQNGEDGVLAAIFEKLGETNKVAFECGAADGLWFSNTRQFIEKGWSGIQVEMEPLAFERLQLRYKDNDRVQTFNHKITANGEHTLEGVLDQAKAPIDLDLLVLDIDSQEYYLFNSLSKYRPRVVMCEFDPLIEEMFIPELNGLGQAGRKAILYVANARGYIPVGQTRCNLIFVREDLVDALVVWPANQAQIVAAGPNVRVGAVMSTPRIGFLGNSDVVYKACYELGMNFSRGEGVFWHHSLTRCIESHLEMGVDYILTVDYDSVFSTSDAARLVCHLYDNPDIDIVASIQMRREGKEALITSDGEVTLNNTLIPITQAHFGLTLIRASVFDRLKKPWFLESPDPTGGWSENRTDPDIHFWKQAREAGLKMMAATDVIVGHVEQVITWPNQTFGTHYQSNDAWRKDGMPMEAFRKPAQLQAATMEMQK